MKLGESYKITVSVNERVLTYTAKIISEDETFITFTDKFNSTFHYNKNNIISVEEIK